MSSNQMGGFYSTPAFELFRRGLQTKTIQKFRGLNVFTPVSSLTPEWAQAALNVIVGQDGSLHKFRVPQVQSPFIPGAASGPTSFFDFQQATGTRQVLGTVNTNIYKFTNNMTAVSLIDNNPLNAGIWSFAEAQNVLYGSNGQRVQKWDGTNWYAWGLPISTTTPTIVNTLATIVSFSLDAAGLGYVVGDVLNIVQAGSVNGQVTVTAIGAGGVITTISVLSLGSGYVAAAGLATTGGTGAGATITASNVAGQLSPQTGYEWSWSWKNSGATGSPINVSTAAPATAQTGSADVDKAFQLQVPYNPPDPQIDTVVWWRTVDGGGTLQRLAEVNINSGVVSFNAATIIPVLVGELYLGIIDDTPDANLDLATQAPLVNNPPIQGKYVAYGQGRVFILDLNGAPQDIIYSGYETILVGNPPECFPPNNRLRLSVGAETVSGGGVIQAGLVAFSQTGNIYMLRGQIEDIVTTSPVVFTQYLEELPWTLGCLSHFTVKSTPHGLVWLAGNKTLQLFDGYDPPQDISGPVYPILRSITPGTETQANAGYFNWLDRDWYVLTCATNGSLSNNTLIFWSFNNALEEIDIFPTSIQCDFVGVVESPTLQRQLVTAAQGRLSLVPVLSDQTGGLTQDFTINPATNAMLSAYWRSGYFGNDQPQRSEMFRYGRIATDQPPGAFKVTQVFCDDINFTMAQPLTIGPYKLKEPKFRINRRAKRCAIEINFPDQDVAASVIELQVSSIPSSDR